ncbi:hypothetical protein PY257_00475, partial [Ramlibacter sp. H39-3-26]|uniref:hypothetical protein n=1 Tax=Curvibacter soli TaxID=3031331 RepID=UPI0023D9AC30
MELLKLVLHASAGLCAAHRISLWTMRGLPVEPQEYPEYLSLSEILCARHNIPPKEFSCLANP